MKKEFRSDIHNVAGSYEGREETRVRTKLLAETMFGRGYGLNDAPPAPRKLVAPTFAVHEIILVPNAALQTKIDKDLDKENFRIDSFSQDLDQPEQYATVYYQHMEKFVFFADAINSLQESGPMECAWIPVYLDMNGARILVYSQTSNLYSRTEVEEQRDLFFKRDMPKTFKQFRLQVEAINEIYLRKEK